MGFPPRPPFFQVPVMASQFESDFTSHAVPALSSTFGESVIYKNAAGDELTITAIVDPGEARQDNAESGQVTVGEIRAEIKISDVEKVEVGESITYNETEYVIEEILNRQCGTTDVLAFARGMTKRAKANYYKRLGEE